MSPSWFDQHQNQNKFLGPHARCSESKRMEITEHCGWKAAKIIISALTLRERDKTPMYKLRMVLYCSEELVYS